MDPRARCSHCKRVGSIGDGHPEHCEGQHALGFIAFFCSHLLAMHVARRVKTSALLTGDIWSVVPCHRGVWVEVRAFCVPGVGGAAATARGIGYIGDGHLEHCEGQVRAFGGSLPFFALICLQCMWQVG